MSWLQKALALQGASNEDPLSKPPKLPKPVKKENQGGSGSFDSFGRGSLFPETCLADFAERVAMLIVSGGHSPEDARRLAMEEMGGEQLELWWYHIEQIPTATTLEGTQLLKAATAFLRTPLAAMAAYYGWDDLAIFGVFNGPSRAMARRHDAMGLVPALAWSRIGSKLVDIDCDRAIIETRTGNTLTHKRQLTGQRYAVPVWWSGILQEGDVDKEWF